MIPTENNNQEMEFDFNLKWVDVPFEMKQEYAKLNNLDLNNISDEYDMLNMWHHARYFCGFE